MSASSGSPPSGRPPPGQPRPAQRGGSAPGPARPPDGPTLRRLRALLALARAACADRAGAEAALAARLEADLAAAESARAGALAEAESALAAALAAAGAAAAEARAAALAAFERRAADAQRQYTVAKSSLEERAGSTLNAAKKERQDAVWLAESLFDTTKDRPRLWQEAAQKDVDERLVVLATRESQIRQWFRQHRMGDLPAAPAPIAPPDGAPPEPAAGDAPALALNLGIEGEGRPPPTVPPVGLLASFDAAFAHAGELSARIWSQRLPAMFSAVWPLTIVLTLAFAAGFTAAWARGWSADAVAGYAAGAGAALGIVLLLLILRFARGRARVLGRQFAESIAAARAAAKAALAHAMEERRRQEWAIAARREREVNSAKERFVAVDESVRARAQEEYARIHTRFKEQQGALTETRDVALAQADARRAGAESAARAAESAARDRALAAHQTALADAQTRRAHAWSALAAAWHAAASAVAAEAAALAALVESQPADWSGAAQPPFPVAPPPAVRLGGFTLDLAALPGGLPADPALAPGVPTLHHVPVALDLPERLSLLVLAAGAERPAGLHLLRAAMLRLLTTLPPAKVRFTILDPVGLGESFAGFMHLADHVPQLVGERIWTETRHIEQRLVDLTEHMETVIQKYLRNEFPTIEDYNRHAGEVAEPYRFLVIADFPAAFSEAAAARLASIVASGPRCGVYTLILADPRARPPGGIAFADLERAAMVVQARKDRLALADPELGPLDIRFDLPPADDQFNRLVNAMGAAAKETGRVRVPFAMVSPAPEARWSLDSAAELRLPLGRAGASKLQHLVLGRGTAQHALIAGRTGSGKSTLLNVMITGAAAWYSPDQVELYLVDFKKGVEFKAYAAGSLPHARVVAIESEREFGLSVLRRLDDELRRRGQLLRDVGAQDLAAYRRAVPGAVMPRTLLVVDEFQELFSEDDRLAQEAALLLDRLVRQGRAFGMHVVLGSQTLAGAYSLARSTIGQMAVRIALQCSEADSYLILSEDNGAARLLSRPGEAIYNDASGMLEGNSPFQVAWLDEATRAAALDLVREKALALGAAAPTPIVFEGNVPADLAACRPLRAAAAAPPGAAAAAPIPLWLGDAVSIKEPTHATLARQAASNLLLVGQQEEPAFAMSAAAVLALLARFAGGPVPAQAVILDGAPADSPLHGRLGALAALAPAMLTAPGYRDVESVLARLAAELDRRQAADATDAPPLVLFVHALHRFRQLRRSEDDFGFSSGAEPGALAADKQFLRLLRDGPPLGMHAVVWCDTYGNFERALGRQALREFDARALMQMSQNDSASLIDVPAAGSLGQNRAIFFTEQGGAIEKFRPFAVPAASVIEVFSQALSPRFTSNPPRPPGADED